jgi:hypothetical protein
VLIRKVHQLDRRLPQRAVLDSTGTSVASEPEHVVPALGAVPEGVGLADVVQHILYVGCRAYEIDVDCTGGRQRDRPSAHVMERVGVEGG